jgi:transposase-like protein
LKPPTHRAEIGGKVATMSNQPEEEFVQRWTAKRRASWVLNVLEGEASVREAARKHDLRVEEVEVNRCTCHP